MCERDRPLSQLWDDRCAALRHVIFLNLLLKLFLNMCSGQRPWHESLILDHVVRAYLYLGISTRKKVMIIFLSHSLEIVTRTEQDLIARSAILHLWTLFKSHIILLGTTTTPSFTLSIVTSSQVRVGMPLPLQSCCISGLGPEGLQQYLKNHFLSILAGVDATFLPYLWDLLLPQAKLTLNLLQQATINPKISAREYFNGLFDFNKSPLASWAAEFLSTPNPQHTGPGTTEQSKASTLALHWTTTDTTNSWRWRQSRRSSPTWLSSGTPISKYSGIGGWKNHQ